MATEVDWEPGHWDWEGFAVLALQEFTSQFEGLLSLLQEANRKMGIALLVKVVGLVFLVWLGFANLRARKSEGSRIRGHTEDEPDPTVQDGRSRWIVCIIDGNELLFSADHLKAGNFGGRTAAITLNLSLLQCFGSKARLHVTVFLDRQSLSDALIEDGTLFHPSQLDEFITGFNQASAVSTIVDVATGKDGTQIKVEDTLQMFASFHQVEKIYFGGGGGDRYTNMLHSLHVGDFSKKLELVGASEISSASQDLQLPSTEISYLFAKRGHPEETSSKNEAIKLDVPPPLMTHAQPIALHESPAPVPSRKSIHENIGVSNLLADGTSRTKDDSRSDKVEASPPPSVVTLPLPNSLPNSGNTISDPPRPVASHPATTTVHPSPPQPFIAPLAPPSKPVTATIGPSQPTASRPHVQILPPPIIVSVPATPIQASASKPKPAQATPPQAQRVDPAFQPLLSMLSSAKAENKLPLSGSKVVGKIAPKGPTLYRQAGVSYYKDYIQTAINRGLIRVVPGPTGVSDPKALFTLVETGAA